MDVLGQLFRFHRSLGRSRLDRLPLLWSRVRPGSIRLSCCGRPEAPASRPDQCSCRLIGQDLLVAKCLTKGLVSHPSEMASRTKSLSWPEQPYEVFHFRLAASHVSQPDWLENFMTNIYPPGLFDDSLSACKPRRQLEHIPRPLHSPTSVSLWHLCL